MFIFGFWKRNATLFNKLEEGCIADADEALAVRCDCIDRYFLVGITVAQRFACSRSRERGQGYRIKRLSACGGCLGDHRR